MQEPPDLAPPSSLDPVAETAWEAPPDFKKFDSGKPRPSLIPPEAELEVAKAFTYGSDLYDEGGPPNYRRGTNWLRYVDALMRHTQAWRSGEDLDPKSGLNHLAHICCNAMILLVLQLGGLGEDDRPKVQK